MDLSDLISTRNPDNSAPVGGPAPVTTADAAAWHVANQLGIDTVSMLTPALESVRQMQATGRIDRASLHALIDHIDRARAAGMLGQQIACLAQGGIPQQFESLNLSDTLRGVLARRAKELVARGVAVQHTLKPSEVMVDATLLSALLDTLLDWSLRHACTAVDLALDVKSWPAHARLTCRFGHTPQDQTVRGHGRVVALDDLSWHLLAQLARTMALSIDREDSSSNTTLTLEFPHTVNGTLEGVGPVVENAAAQGATASQPLAGTRVLVVARRREVVNQVRQTLVPLGLQVDCVASVDEARAFCQQALPQAIVYESMVYDSAFDGLRTDIRQQCPDLAWVEIIEQGDAFEISSFGGMSMARVGRDAIAGSLPSALMFELARGL